MNKKEKVLRKIVKEEVNNLLEQTFVTSNVEFSFTPASDVSRYDYRFSLQNKSHREFFEILLKDREVDKLMQYLNNPDKNLGINRAMKPKDISSHGLMLSDGMVLIRQKPSDASVIEFYGTTQPMDIALFDLDKNAVREMSKKVRNTLTEGKHKLRKLRKFIREEVQELIESIPDYVTVHVGTKELLRQLRKYDHKYLDLLIKDIKRTNPDPDDWKYADLEGELLRKLRLPPKEEKELRRILVKTFKSFT